MTISIHGRAAVNDSMLLYRVAYISIRSFSSVPRAGNRQNLPSRLKYRTMWWPWPMSKVEDGSAFIIFFLTHTTRGHTDTGTRYIGCHPTGRIEFIFGLDRVIVDLSRDPVFYISLPSPFRHPFPPISPLARFGREEKIAIYRRAKAYAHGLCDR